VDPHSYTAQAVPKLFCNTADLGLVRIQTHAPNFGSVAEHYAFLT
jgi:hypothetical protein